jgi:hypothetical protein
MARVHAGVAQLVDLSKLAGFTLPEELVAAYEAAVTIQELTLSPPPLLDVETGAEQLTATVIRGEPVDLLQLGRDIELGTRTRSAVQAGQLAQRSALERSVDRLTSLAHSLADEIIVTHLQPAYRAVLAEAEEPAKIVRQHPLSSQNLRLKDTNEVRSVRAALRKLEPAAARRTAIAQARVQANRLGARKPLHDTDNSFANLRRPMALVPGWVPGSRFAFPAVPVDPIEHLVWLTGEAAIAEPWMPSCEQQDQIWLSIYGEELARRQARSTSWPTVIANG